MTRYIYLAWNGPLSEQALRAALQDYGEVEDLRIRDGETRHFGFCDYKTLEAAAKLLDHGDLVVEGIDVLVRARNPLDSIFLKNIAWAVTQQDLWDLASRFGTVTFVQIASERGSGRSSGFGFVAMDTLVELQAALEGLNGAECQGRILQAEQAERGERNRRPRDVRPDDSPTRTQAPSTVTIQEASTPIPTRVHATPPVMYCGKGRKRRVRHDASREDSWQ